jgi:hypothetical protein
MLLASLVTLKLKLQRLWFVRHVLPLAGNDGGGEQRRGPNMFGLR